MNASADAATAQRRLPWHDAAWARLCLALRDDRLPHGLLFSGVAGVGKAVLAQHLANALVCQTPLPSGDPCGSCRSCRLSAVGHHPDIHWYRPEEGSRVIKVEAIRALTDASVLTVGGSGRSVFLIDPADGMNGAAANALLKTLEEPVGGAVLILISANSDRLPATIRSRCQPVVLAPPSPADGQAWLVAQGLPADQSTRLLGLYGGAPLAALQGAATEQLAKLDEQWRQLERLADGRGDPVALAASWDADDLAGLLDWLIVWTLDLIRLQAAPGSVPRFDPAAVARFQTLANRLDCRDLHGFLDCLYELRRRLTSNINSLLALEKVLLDWTRLTARTP